jgi:hypothetical protein
MTEVMISHSFIALSLFQVLIINREIQWFGKLLSDRSDCRPAKNYNASVSGHDSPIQKGTRETAFIARICTLSGAIALRVRIHIEKATVCYSLATLGPWRTPEPPDTELDFCMSIPQGGYNSIFNSSQATAIRVQIMRSRQSNLNK